MVQALGSRLVAVNAMQPNVMPHYVYVDASGKRLELFANRQQNGITINGPDALSGQMVRLLRSFDRLLEPGAAQRVVPMNRTNAAKVQQAVQAYRNGSKLEPPAAPGNPPAKTGSARMPRGSAGLITHLIRPRAGVEPAVATAPGFDSAVRLAAAEEPVKPAAPMRSVAPDVEAEVLTDLDVIILRGREQEVGELQKIIQELDRLSAETQPEIEIYALRHVNGDAVATLITKVQDALAGGMRGRVQITPLGKPNALLLIGWGEAVKAVKELLAKLDQPVEPETQFKTFPLRYAPAASAKTTVTEFFANRTGLFSKVIVSADQRTNAIVVQAAPRDMAEIEAVIASIDRGESPAINQTRVIKLKYTLATDLNTTLTAAISAAKGGSSTTGTTTSSSGKSSALELVTVDQSGKKILKSGILADVQVTPDPRLNTLIVSAPAESIELVVALIQQLDSPVSTAQIKVFRVANGDAANLVLMLRSLLVRPETGTGSSAQIPITQDEPSLTPLRFSVDPRTNSIIAVGSSGDLRIVEALLLRLDEQDVAERKNATFRLKNSPALDVANAINTLLTSERQLTQASPGMVGASQQIEGEVVVVPEPVSNTLIVSATPRFFKKIADLVEKLDAQPPQVVVQVVIAEVELGNYDEFGMEVGLQDSVLFDRSLLGNLISLTRTAQQSTSSGIITSTQQDIVAASNTPGFNFNGTDPLGNSGSSKSLATGPTVGSQGISNFGVTRGNTKKGYGGLVLSASSYNVNFLLRAMQELHCLRVISRPQIQTLDNQPAFVQVGKRVPRITGTAINQVGQSNTVALENIGLILGVTPRISPDGLVVMEVDAEKSELGPESEGIPVAFSAQGTVIKSPVIEVTTAQTTVSATSGDTILLGGLIQKSNEVLDRRVPWLSDIPVLGNLFRYKTTDTSRRELLIILTPHVVRNQADADRVRQMESARMNWCLRDIEQIHGSVTSQDSNRLEMPVIYPDSNPRGILSQGAPTPAKPSRLPDVPEPVTPPPPSPGATDQ